MAEDPVEVFFPTQIERSDPTNVLDGDLDEFIEASLKAGL